MYTASSLSDEGLLFQYIAVQCRYNSINILTDIRKRHPIAGPIGLGMGCHMWIQHLIDILLQYQ